MEGSEGDGTATMTTTQEEEDPAADRSPSVPSSSQEPPRRGPGTRKTNGWRLRLLGGAEPDGGHHRHPAAVGDGHPPAASLGSGFSRGAISKRDDLDGHRHLLSARGRRGRRRRAARYNGPISPVMTRRSPQQWKDVVRRRDDPWCMSRRCLSGRYPVWCMSPHRASHAHPSSDLPRALPANCTQARWWHPARATQALESPETDSRQLSRANRHRRTKTTALAPQVPWPAPPAPPPRAADPKKNVRRWLW